MARHMMKVERDGTFRFPSKSKVAVAEPTKLAPTHNFVHCRAVAIEPEKDSMIIRPETAEGDYHLADVLAVGPGLVTPTGERVPCCVKPGDRVIVNITRITWVDDPIRRRVDAEGVAFVLPDDGILAVVQR
jgi:co-chaperonin GroES (HSP10)